MLEGIAVLLAEVHDELDDLRCGVRDLDGIRLDVSHRKPSRLHLILKRSHKQSTTKSHNIVLIADITERVIEVGAGKTIDTVDCDLQGLCQVFCRGLIIQIRRQLSSKELPGSLVIFVLDRDTSVQNILEVLGVLPEDIHGDGGIRVHGCDIKQSNIPIHPRFGVNIAAFSNVITAIHVLAINELISRKCGENICPLIGRIARLSRGQIGIDESRFLLLTKYNSGGQCIGRIVDRQTSYFGQDLSCGPVALQMVKDCFCSKNIVIAILRDLCPTLLRYRLIPWKTEFLVMNTQFDLPFFQALFLSGKVIHIRIRHVIRLTKESISTSADDLLRQVVQLQIVIADQPSVQNMVIISTTVEPNQSIPHQILDLFRSRIDHANHGLSLALNLPVDQEQVREDLHIVKYQRLFVVRNMCRSLIGLKPHLVHQFDAVICLMGAPRSKRQNAIPHVGHIIIKAAVISILKPLIDEIDTRFGGRVILFVEVSLDEGSQCLFAFHPFKVDHFLFSFHG